MSTQETRPEGPTKKTKKTSRDRAKAEARRAVIDGAGQGGESLVSAEAMAPALARVWAEIDAMSVEGLGRITLYVPVAVTIAVGAVPNVEAMRDEIRRRAPDVDLERISRLSDYAQAAHYAHIVAVRQAEAKTMLPVLLAEASPLRERLLRSAELLAHFGALRAERVAAIRRGTGHLDVVNDLTELALLFRDSWSEIAGKTPVMWGEVERADELGYQLLVALGRRDVGTDGANEPSKATEDRLKAFWLFFRVYEEVRRAFTFLRWYEGDAEVLAPSLYRARRPRGPGRRKSPDEPAAPASEEPALVQSEGLARQSCVFSAAGGLASQCWTTEQDRTRERARATLEGRLEIATWRRSPDAVSEARAGRDALLRASRSG